MWIVPFDLALKVMSFCLISIASKIVPSGCGVDNSLDCIRVDRVLFETLIITTGLYPCGLCLLI